MKRITKILYIISFALFIVCAYMLGKMHGYLQVTSYFIGIEEVCSIAEGEFINTSKGEYCFLNGASLNSTMLYSYGNLVVDINRTTNLHDNIQSWIYIGYLPKRFYG